MTPKTLPESEGDVQEAPIGNASDAAGASHSPAMRQYHALKAQYRDALLFFRMGDFYEMFFEDAVLAARALDIALTSRQADKNGTPIPMCGVPHHAAGTYIARLVKLGHSVAVCEQLEDARLAKGVVRRDVVRVVTPGTQTDAVEPEEDAFLLAIAPGKQSLGVAWLEATTGEFLVAEWDDPGRFERLRDELGATRPREILVPPRAALPAWLLDAHQPEAAIPRTELEESSFEWRTARDELLRHFGVVTLEAFGCEDLSLGTAAAGAALRYLRETQKRDLTHVTGLRLRHGADALVLDRITRRNLELVENMSDGGRSGTLLAVLDETGTAMGARRLRQWILRPLVGLEEIRDRLDAVEELAFRTLERARLREVLSGIQDLDRIVGRVTLGTASPRDLLALSRSLRLLPEIRLVMAELEAPLLRRTLKGLAPLPDVVDDIVSTLADPPPASPKEGGLIREGVDRELDELREVSRGGRGTIAAIEERERRRTGISSLKVRFNRVFGYYIEVSKPNLELVPPDYIRKQTVAQAERFVTAELKDYEEKVLDADEKILQKESALFEALSARVAVASRPIQEASSVLAVLDVLASLAEVACRHNYVKPRVSDGGELAYVEGRHPVMERVLDGPFVANDLAMGDDRPRLLIVTGPNMGGKSTFLRQTALLSLMAQMGSFVPAREAKLPIVDRIFTRVGAGDQILRGQSTFLVEMHETAHILRHATPASLVLLDEIGRGTATFDGLSIAWAVAETLARQGPKTLFATHYHELTDLALDLPAVGNLHVSAKEWRDDVIFLRRIEPGASDRSFGVQVARLAGLPPEVVARAQEILANLESGELDREGRPRLAHSPTPSSPLPRQLPLFVQEDEAVLDELRRCEVERMTPLEAIALLAELKKRLR